MSDTPKKRRVHPLIWLSLVIVIGAVIGITNSEQRERQTQEQARLGALSPEQLIKEKADKDKRDAQLQAAAAGALALKRAMKDPLAFELTSLVLKPNGTACYEYRAKNSYGAILPSSAVLTSAGKMLAQERDGNAFVKVWNKECTPAGGQEIAALVRRIILER